MLLEQKRPNIIFSLIPRKISLDLEKTILYLANRFCYRESGTNQTTARPNSSIRACNHVPKNIFWGGISKCSQNTRQNMT